MVDSWCYTTARARRSSFCQTGATRRTSGSGRRPRALRHRRRGRPVTTWAILQTSSTALAAQRSCAARIEGVVSELYDVIALPGVLRPMALGFKTEEIQRMLHVGDQREL